MKKFTIDQLIKILAEADTPGNSVAATARKYGLSEQTIYRWRKNTWVSPPQKPNAPRWYPNSSNFIGKTGRSLSSAGIFMRAIMWSLSPREFPWESYRSWPTSYITGSILSERPCVSS